MKFYFNNIFEDIVTVNMTDKKLITANGQSYNKVERYGNKVARYFSNSNNIHNNNNNNNNYARKKNNSFSTFQTVTTETATATPTAAGTPDANTINYYSDNSSSNVHSINVAAINKKCRQRRSHSSSPVLNSSHYAGAKFSEPPNPNVLPLPPSHWTVAQQQSNTPPRSVTPEDFTKTEITHTSTPIAKVLQRPQPIRSSSSCIGSPVNMNQSVELFFKKCSFNQVETCKDFTKQLKTLLNVPA